MNDRYIEIYSLPKKQYNSSAPIIIEGGALYKDTSTNKLIALFKFLSVTKKNIVKLKISIIPKDILLNCIGEAIVYEYSDLNVNFGESFAHKTPIEIDVNNIKTFEIIIEECIFSDKSCWNGKNVEYKQIPNQKLINVELPEIYQQEYYKNKFGTDAEYLYQEFEDLALCTCGAVNKISDSFCNECKCKLSELKNIDYPLFKEEVLDNIKEKSFKKKKTFLGILLSIISIIIVAVLLTNFVIVPAQKKNLLLNSRVGDYVFFGNYEQDGNKSNGKEEIEWLVIDRCGNEVLLLSRYVIDTKKFNNQWVDITWENCTLRNWLNSDFIDSAFKGEEKDTIIKKFVSADENPFYKTNQGNNTYDKVFILSVEELYKYDLLDSYTLGIAVKAALEDYDCEVEDTGAVLYWLRTVGDGINKNIALIHDDGSLREEGVPINNYIGVRPAIWVDLNKIQ